MTTEHKCKEFDDRWSSNPYTEYKIMYKSDKNGWYLKHKSCANKIMVENGEADKEWELISQFEFQIYYCPFCGKVLSY